MEPQWISAVVAALMFGLAVGNFVGARRERVRKALPIVRVEWTQGTAGIGAKMAIVNRSDEDICINEIAAKGAFAINQLVYDDGGSIARSIVEIVGRQRKVNWLVKPGETRHEVVQISGASTPRWIRLTMSSSASTLRRRRFVSRDSQNV